MRLLEAIFGLEESRQRELALRWRVSIDPKKRLTLAEQVARGIVDAPQRLSLKDLSEGASEALRLLLAAPNGLPREALPAGYSQLVSLGIVFRDPGRPERVLIPSAFRLQLPGSPSDGPRAARLLLLSVPEDPRRDLCRHHLARLPPLPWPMLLETVLERLEDPAWIKRQLSELPDPERGLIVAMDAHGGEATAEEVLALAREPRRIAQGGSFQVPRSSAIFGLARKGLVLDGQRSWIIPDEVERVVGRERRARAGVLRQRLYMSRHVHELTPSRADLADSLGAAAVAAVGVLSSIGQMPKTGCGASRAALRRVAFQLHLPEGKATMLACLARAAGLPYSSATIQSASERLWESWRRGGAWDEAASDPDPFRPGHPTSARPASLVREVLLDTLLLLPAHEFVLRSDVVEAACADSRVLSAQRSLTLAARAGQPVRLSVGDVVGELLDHSLPWLGLIDRGVVEQGQVIRLASRARAWLSPEGAAGTDSPVERSGVWLADSRLLCGPSCDAAAVVEAARYGEVWLDDHSIGVSFERSAMEAATDTDPDLSGLRAALSSLSSSLPTALDAQMRGIVASRPTCSLLRCAGFVEVEDPDLRESLFSDSECQGMWAGRPLSTGLLVRDGANLRKLAQLLARHGVRLQLVP